MMRTAASIIGLAFATCQAFAASEPYAVTAGEHTGFSRIVFEKGAENAVVEHQDRIVRLYDTDQSIAFGFSEINDRRKAYRVLNAKQVATKRGVAIELSLNCDCKIKTAYLDNGKFVLDILDSTPLKLVQPKKKPPQTTTDADPAADNAQLKEELMSVEQAHSRMVMLLKQAAREGLITIKDDAVGDDQAASPAQSAADIALESKKNTTADTVPAQNTRIASHEREPRPAEKNTQARPIENRKCFSDDAFAIDGGDFDVDPLVQISNLQAELAEAEAPDNEAVMLQLVSGFLSIGFGEEALALLSDFGRRDSLTADLARTIAERPADPNGPLRGAANCTGAHALWQAAAGAPENAPVFFMRSNNAIETLPHRLKALIATRLAMKMIAAAAWKEAEDLYAVADAATETASPELDYVRARLDEHQGDGKASRDALIEIAAQNSNASDDALLALAESYLENNATPHDGFTEDIGALAKVQESSNAILAEATAWANIGNLDAALLLLQSIVSKSPDDLGTARKAARSIFETAFASSDRHTQVAALDAFLAHENWLSLRPDEIEMRKRIAQTALRLGLPNLAFALLDGEKTQDDKDYLHDKALAALLADDPETAIQISAPHTGDAAFGEIVVKANLQQAKYHDALAAAATLADENRKALMTSRAAWLARSWKSAATAFHSLDPNLLDQDAALQFALASYMTRDKTLPSAADAVLSKQNDVLINGARSLFDNEPGKTALERSRRSVKGADDEIRMFEEILSDG